MRAGPTTEVLSGAYSWTPKVSSWLGSELLADTIPVVAGRIYVDSSQQIADRLTFVAPEVSRGVSWVPDTPDHPLARYGQYVDVSIEVTSTVTGVVYDTRVGRFQIQDWEHDDVARTVTVECVGLLQQPADARLIKPTGPLSNGTFVSEFSRLMVPGIPVNVDGNLTDRAVPQSFTYSDDRLADLYEIADAWPARIRVDSYGVVNVLPPLPTTVGPAVVSFTDGSRGTVVQVPKKDSRDKQYNVVVARSSNTDSATRAPVQGVAQVAGGWMDPNGNYGQVVRFWSSPLATTSAQLAASAQAILNDGLRQSSVLEVTCAPDPRVELDDVANVTRGAKVTPGIVRRLRHVNLVQDPRTKATTTFTAPANAALSIVGGRLRLTENAAGSCYAYPRFSSASAYFPAPQGTKIAARVKVTGMAGKTTYANLVLQGYTSANAGDAIAGQSGYVAIAAGATVVLEAIATVSSSTTAEVLPLLRFSSAAAGADPAVGDYLDSTEWMVQTGTEAPTSSPVPYFTGATRHVAGYAYAWQGAVDASHSSEFQLVESEVIDTSNAKTDTGYVVGYELPLVIGAGGEEMKVMVGVTTQ